MIELLDVVGPAWVQDGGRRGRAGEGIPPGGPLVPERLAAANSAVGNAADTAAIEVFGSVTVAARGGDVRIGWQGAVVDLARDHVRRFVAIAPAYLAVAGGLDVPVVLGGRGFLQALGCEVLRAGARLPVGTHRGATTPLPEPVFNPEAPIRVMRGPNPAGFADLLSVEWTIGSGDRVGVRLLGPALPVVGEDHLPSAPMVRGAIQLPAGGQPVVLGPDHPTTGGYPVVAVVRHLDLGALAARGVGARVRFWEG